MSKDETKKMTIVIPSNLNYALKAVAARERCYIQYIAAEMFSNYIKEKHPDIYEEYHLAECIAEFLLNKNR